MTAQERLEEELDKTQRVIEMIYYFGSQLEDFDEAELVEMSQNQYWKPRIDALRRRIQEEHDKFEERMKNKKIKFDEDEGKSDGDVE